LELQPFSPRDADRAHALFRSRAGTFFDPNEEEYFEETLEFIADTGYAPEQQRFWAAWRDGENIAFGGVEWIDVAGYLFLGKVHPDFSGRGFGSQLLQHRLDFLRESGVQSLFSDTSQLVDGFYARHGLRRSIVGPNTTARRYCAKTAPCASGDRRAEVIQDRRLERVGLPKCPVDRVCFF
jgi:GNAT superfamily N-acetyltransferase